MYIYGQLRKAQLENSTSDPTKRGEVLFRTDQTKFKFYDGSAVRSVVTEDSTQTLTNKTLSGNTAVTLISGSGTLTLNTTGTITLPNATDTLVGKATTDILTNKTIDGDDNTVQDLALTSLKTVLADASKFIVRDASGIPVSNTKAVPSGVVVGDTDTQTLSNKTLTSPTINTPTMSGPYINDYIELDEESSNPSSPAIGKKRIFAKNDGLVYTKDSSGTVAPLGAGGGSGGLEWYFGDSNAPSEVILSNGQRVLDFAQSPDEQEMFVQIKVPASYVAGMQIKLVDGKFFAALTTGNVLFRTVTYLFANTIDATSVPTGHTSTNTQDPVQGTTNQIAEVSEIDLTDASGEINNVAVGPGDVLLIKFYRDTSAETSGLAGDARLLRASFEPKFTV